MMIYFILHLISSFHGNHSCFLSIDFTKHTSFRNRDLSSPGLGAICTSLFNILQAFKDPRTTHEEFIALKATILINSIPATITTTKSFRMLTNQIYQALRYTCDSNPSVYHDNYTRHFTLLLQLPHIKTLSLKLIRLFVDMRAGDLLPQADLLLEMLDAQEAPDISSSFLALNTENNGSSLRPPSLGQDLTTNANQNDNHTAINSSKARTDYPTSNNFNQRQDADDQAQGTADLNGESNEIFSLHVSSIATETAFLRLFLSLKNANRTRGGFLLC